MTTAKLHVKLISLLVDACFFCSHNLFLDGIICDNWNRLHKYYFTTCV